MFDTCLNKLDYHNLFRCLRPRCLLRRCLRRLRRDGYERPTPTTRFLIGLIGLIGLKGLNG
jgi:hypothetical protein